MFKLSTAQCDEFRVQDAGQFVRAVGDQFLNDRPEMIDRPGRDGIYERMRQAFDFAMRAGFQSTPHVIRLMYFSADAPGIHDEPAVSAHLQREGASPEQRLDDLMAVVKNKLKGVS